MDQQPLIWRAHEHEHRERSTDWFWALGILALAGAAAAVILGNILFGILILIGAFTVALFAARRPGLFLFKIDARGINIDKVLYPYQSLESFWVEDTRESVTPKLLLRSKKALMHHIIIPLEGISPKEVRKTLAERLPEIEDSEPLSHKILELFGF